MKLLTAELRKKLPKLYSQENNPDPIVVCKFFDPCGSWTWYVLEASAKILLPGGAYAYEALRDIGKEGTLEDVIFFGLVHGYEKELGYFSLKELESFRGPMGLGIERDLHWTPAPLSSVKSGDVT